MKNLLRNQKGVTLIESLAASVIIVLLLGTLLGALVFGQKVIVGSDEKTRAAAEAQEMIDSLMEDSSNKKVAYSKLIDKDGNRKFISDGAGKTKPNFTKPENSILSKQYSVLPLDKDGKSLLDKDGKLSIEDPVENSVVAYRVYVRVYYNQGEAYVDLTAFVKKGGVGE